jgi:hypothetical protein
MALLLSALLAGCGGSGSSGFDVSPLIEDEAISGALESGECGTHEGLEICPAVDSTGAIPGNPGPIATPERGVVFDVPPEDGLACQQDAGDGCAFTLFFHSIGLPAEAAYRVAVRPVAPEPGDWVVGADLVTAGSAERISIAIPPGATSVQVALLTFEGGNDAAPGGVRTLAETGASYAFVTGALEVDRLAGLR